MSEVRYDERLRNIKRDLEDLKFATKSQERDLRKLRDLRKDSNNLDDFINEISKLNENTEKLIEAIKNEDLRDVKDSLESLESKREEIPFEKLRELKNRDISDSQEKIIDKILSEEEKIRTDDKEIAGLIPKIVDDKKRKLANTPTLVFKSTELNKFLEHVDKELDKGINGHETGGVFHYEEIDEGFYLDKFIFLPNDREGEYRKPRYEHDDQTWKMIEEKGSENNFFHAHSHPSLPNMRAGLSQGDKDSMEKSDMQIEILALEPEKHGDYSKPFIVPYKLHGDNNTQSLAVRVINPNGQDITDEYETIRTYNKFLEMSVYYSGSWVDFLKQNREL